MKFNRGDIVNVDLNPVKGHEQGNERPVVVINDLPLPGGVYIVLPITNQKKGFPFEIELDERTKTTGVILCFQIRTIDLSTREASFIEKLPQDLLDQCGTYLEYLVLPNF